jgi:hypothetical protein
MVIGLLVFSVLFSGSEMGIKDLQRLAADACGSSKFKANRFLI